MKETPLTTHYRRVKEKGYMPPLRTIDEIAEELGLTRAKLAALIRDFDGPKSKLKHSNNRTTKATWYDPVEVRRWYKGVINK